MDNLIFRQGRWDGAVSMPEFDRVRDDLALGVTLDELEAPVRIRSHVAEWLSDALSI